MSGTAGDVLVPPGTIGYLDRISAAPGEAVKLHVSSTAPTWRAELVRLLALEIPGFDVPRRVRAVAGFAPVEREGIEQGTVTGSYGEAPPLGADQLEGGLTIALSLMPTRPGAGPQAALAQRTADGGAGWSLGLDADGAPCLRCATAAGPFDLCGPEPLRAGCWYRLTATIDPRAGRATLRAEPVGTFAANRLATGRGEALALAADLPGVPVAAPEQPLLLGCAALDGGGQPLEGFDGRLERPALLGAPDPAPGGFEDLLGRPDLLAAVQQQRDAGAFVVALVNAESSPLADLADVIIPLSAGVERSVAATKSYIASLAAIAALVAAWTEDAALETALTALPAQLMQAFALDWSPAVGAFQGATNLFVLGRGYGLGVAQEAALKFKETSGLHAESFSAAEVRHGPMAIVGAAFHVLAFGGTDRAAAGVRTVADEFRARNATVLLADPVGGDLPAIAAHPAIEPILMIQSFYRMASALALARGHNPDSPPHLNKVTETL